MDYEIVIIKIRLPSVQAHLAHDLQKTYSVCSMRSMSIVSIVLLFVCEVK